MDVSPKRDTVVICSSVWSKIAELMRKTNKKTQTNHSFLLRLWPVQIKSLHFKSEYDKTQCSLQYSVKCPDVAKSCRKLMNLKTSRYKSFTVRSTVCPRAVNEHWLNNVRTRSRGRPPTEVISRTQTLGCLGLCPFNREMEAQASAVALVTRPSGEVSL